MPRYFFDVLGQPVFRDAEGEEFRNLEAARDHAIYIAEQLRSRPSDEQGVTHSEVIVRDDGGEIFRLKLTTH
jgi:hypothetical protein